MKVYVTSKNTGPSYQSDPIHVVYIGRSVSDAINAVGDFNKYQTTFSVGNYGRYDSHSAIPGHMERKMVALYMADGWWYSVVEIDI